MSSVWRKQNSATWFLGYTKGGSKAPQANMTFWAQDQEVLSFESQSRDLFRGFPSRPEKTSGKMKGWKTSETHGTAEGHGTLLLRLDIYSSIQQYTPGHTPKTLVYPAVAVWFSTKTNPRCFRCPLSFVGEIVIHPVFGNTPFPPAWHHNVITRCLCCSRWVIVNWRNGLLRSAVSTCLGCFCWNSLVSLGTESRVSRVMMMMMMMMMMTTTMAMITGRPLVLGGA